MSLSSIGIQAPQGVLFTFEKADDVLPMHRHTRHDVHVTCIMRGRFRVHGPVFGDKEYGEGAFIDWPVDMEHEFVALTDNARIANFLKYPQ